MILVPWVLLEAQILLPETATMSGMCNGIFRYCRYARDFLSNGPSTTPLMCATDDGLCENLGRGVQGEPDFCFSFFFFLLFAPIFRTQIADTSHT
jgi:hypothetical protein